MSGPNETLRTFEQRAETSLNRPSVVQHQSRSSSSSASHQQLIRESTSSIADDSSDSEPATGSLHDELNDEPSVTDLLSQARIDELQSLPSLPPVSDQRRQSIMKELLQRLSFRELGEITCSVCDLLTPVRDMMAQRTLDLPASGNGTK